MTTEPQELPDYRQPPVVEIIAAVQFVPLPVFGAPQVVAIGKALDDWTVVDVPPSIPPMSEGPLSASGVGQQAFFGFGAAPIRAILTSEDGRWTAQIQQDRVAVHERKVEDRPSFRNVAPKLRDFATRAGQALDAELFGPHHPPDLIEVIYENQISSGHDCWRDFRELHRVLRIVRDHAGAPPYDKVEQASVGFTYAVTDDGTLLGRLRVIAEPQYDQDARPMLALRLVSRRFVPDARLDSVLEAAHADIVRGFTAITTDEMHQHWGRIR
jgi:hypothetical protein